MLPKEYCCSSLILNARFFSAFFFSACLSEKCQAYSLKMSVILLRVRGGLDFSAHIVDEELVEPEVMMM